MMAEAQALPQPDDAAPAWDPLQVWRAGKG